MDGDTDRQRAIRDFPAGKFQTAGRDSKSAEIATPGVDRQEQFAILAQSERALRLERIESDACAGPARRCFAGEAEGAIGGTLEVKTEF